MARGKKKARAARKSAAGRTRAKRGASRRKAGGVASRRCPARDEGSTHACGKKGKGPRFNFYCAEHQHLSEAAKKSGLVGASAGGADKSATTIAARATKSAAFVQSNLFNLFERVNLAFGDDVKISTEPDGRFLAEVLPIERGSAPEDNIAGARVNGTTKEGALFRAKATMLRHIAGALVYDAAEDEERAATREAGAGPDEGPPTPVDDPPAPAPAGDPVMTDDGGRGPVPSDAVLPVQLPATRDDLPPLDPMEQL